MSYVLEPAPRRGGLTPGVWLAVIAGVIVAVLIAGLLIARPDTTAGAEPELPVTQTITWTTVGDVPVPVSAEHGPHEVVQGVPVGFSHDALGAALAAIHINARLTADVGPQVYEAVARESCVGDVEQALAVVRGARSAAPAGAAVPEAYFYKVSNGDPTGDEVLISLAALSPQSRQQGGYVAVTRTLRWVEGDWKLLVPPIGPALISSVDSYIPLGSPDV
jgi:hypothetical protein